MVDLTLPLLGLSAIAGKEVVARFDAGRLSSDGGLLLLREIERRLAAAERLAACIEDRRDPGSTLHPLADIIRFRLLMIAASYEGGNEATSLRRSGVQDGARTATVGSGPVFTVDYLAAGEPTGCTHAAAPRRCFGRSLLPVVSPGAAADHPRH